jgi:hypothetical protein
LIGNLDNFEGREDVKAIIKAEVKRLWQKMDSFKIPSGQRNAILMLRNHCLVMTAPTVEAKNVAKPRRLALKQIQEKFQELASKYLLLLPARIRDESHILNITRSVNDHHSWNISCPLCSANIAVTVEGTRCIASNFKRHIIFHQNRATPVETAAPSEPVSQCDISQGIDNSDRETSEISSPPAKRVAVEQQPSVSPPGPSPGPSRMANTTPRLERFNIPRVNRYSTVSIGSL